MVGNHGFFRDGLIVVFTADNTTGAGFTGHGFGFAWLAGQSLANMITDTPDTFAKICSPRRFI